MKRAGAKTGRVRSAVRRASGESDADELAESKARSEAAEIRRALGVDSAFGYYIDDKRRRAAEALGHVTVAATGTDAHKDSYPCLDGYTYRGCLGAACALDTCWTGGPTVSFARKQREETRVSSAMYLPGAPCHTCIHLVEDTVTVPAPHVTHTTGTARRGARRARSGHAAGDDQSREPATVTLQRITCGQGLWAHPISLASFLAKRIPMFDQEEPEWCPGYAPRPDPHPAVVAHLRRRRERARLGRTGHGAPGHRSGD